LTSAQHAIKVPRLKYQIENPMINFYTDNSASLSAAARSAAAAARRAALKIRNTWIIV